MAFGESVPVRPGVKMDPATGDEVQLPGVPHSLEGCIIAPGASGESLEVARDGDWDSVTIYVTEPVTRGVKRTDIVTVRGQDYDVTGLPPAWVDPEGETDVGGLVILATRVEG
jgi:hypothetical protein